MPTVVGVDGCRDGWFYFRSDSGVKFKVLPIVKTKID